MATVPTITSDDKRALWLSFRNNVGLVQLLEEEFDKAIGLANTLSGVTPANLEKRVGILEGLQSAKGILQRKTHLE